MEGKYEVIQPENWLQPNALGRKVPVFLIHDGGGTTFGYHCLDALHRPVYGISNPHFHTGDKFEGGIPEMGTLYAGHILEAISDPDFPRKRNPDGSMDIILGGWSLGGLLSLEIARQLAENPDVRIIGILMVDSVCPIRPSVPVTIAPSDTSEEGKTLNQILSQRAMTEAGRMMQTWELPRWNEKSPSPRPPIVLVRARDYTPTKFEGVRSVDVHREDRNLGWDLYDKEMLKAVIDVEGHHYELYDFQKIKTTTAAMEKGLETLEEGEMDRKLG